MELPLATTLRGRGNLLLLGALIVIVLAAVVVGDSFRRYDLAADYYVRTVGVLTAVSEVESALLDVETGSRGFALTGDTAYLEPYDRGVAQLPARLGRLLSLAADQPNQRAAVERLGGTARARVAHAGLVVESLRREGLQAAARVIATGEGKRLMDQARRELVAIETAERRLLEQREAAAERRQAWMTRTTLAALALAVVFLTASFALIARERQRRDLADARLRTVVASVPSALVLVDADGRIRLTNNQAEDLFGYQAAELWGRSVEALLPERFREQHAELRRGFVDRPGTQPMGAGRDLYAVRKDGREVPVEIGLSPIEFGTERLVLASVIDITARKQADDRLRRTLELQRAILDGAGYAVIAGTTEGVITLFNPAAERMLGYRAEEMVGLQTPAVFHDADEVVARARLFSEELGETVEPGFEVFVIKARRGLPNEHEWTYVHRSGRRFPVLLSVTALHDADGTITGFLGIATDISDRKRMENRLRAKNEELKAFAYTVSHDLKAPLRGITGYAQELERRHRDGLPERGRFCVSQIVSAAKNLDQLIEDLLKYSRLDSETPTPTDVLLAPLVESILRDRSHAMAESRVEVSTDVPPLTVRVWQRGLHQVLANLIDNAVKYSRESQPPRLTITADELPGRVRISVADNGIGFDMKYHDRIFGLFNRLVRAGEFEGTGAGLAIVRKIAEKIDATIHAESAPGQGATFVVELPMAPSGDPT